MWVCRTYATEKILKLSFFHRSLKVPCPVTVQDFEQILSKSLRVEFQENSVFKLLK